MNIQDHSEIYITLRCEAMEGCTPDLGLLGLPHWSLWMFLGPWCSVAPCGMWFQKIMKSRNNSVTQLLHENCAIGS